MYGFPSDLTIRYFPVVDADHPIGLNSLCVFLNLFEACFLACPTYFPQSKDSYSSVYQILLSIGIFFHTFRWEIREGANFLLSFHTPLLSFQPLFLDHAEEGFLKMGSVSGRSSFPLLPFSLDRSLFFFSLALSGYQGFSSFFPLLEDLLDLGGEVPFFSDGGNSPFHFLSLNFGFPLEVREDGPPHSGGFCFLSSSERWHM